MARGFTFKTPGLSEFNQLTATRQAFEKDRTQSIKNAFNDISLAMKKRKIEKKYGSLTSPAALQELAVETATLDPAASKAYSTAFDSQLSADKLQRDLDLKNQLFGGVGYPSGGTPLGSDQLVQAPEPDSGIRVTAYDDNGNQTGTAGGGAATPPRNLIQDSRQKYFEGQGIGPDGLSVVQRDAVRQAGILDTQDGLKAKRDFISENNRAFREDNKAYVAEGVAWQKANPYSGIKKYNVTLNQLTKTQQNLSKLVNAKELSESSFSKLMLSSSGFGATLRGALLPKDVSAKALKALFPLNPELAEMAVQIPDQIATVVQDSLRQILGAAYTQVEGENVLKRAFDPKDSDANNLVKVTRLLERMEAYGKGQQELAEHLRLPGGTIRNFRPSNNSVSVEVLTEGVNSQTGKKELSLSERASFYNKVLSESGAGGMSDSELQKILDTHAEDQRSTISKAFNFAKGDK